MAREVAAVLGIVVAILVVALHQPTQRVTHEVEPALADGDAPDEVPVLASAADGI